MKKKLLAVGLCAVLAASCACLAACGGKGGGNELGLKPTEAVELPVEGTRSDNIKVHDPSVFRDPKDGKYYAFGSHYAVASSDDLINWEQEVEDTEFQKLYGEETYKRNNAGASWPAAIKDTVDLVKPTDTNTTWAPDVNFHNNKYYMYYSLTSGFGSSHSAIGRVVADSPLGPYSDNTVIIDSMQGEASDPNCIDPELFEDKDGGLWMVYGSHFGGIYLLELENAGDNWGLPKENSTNNAENNGFGKKLWNGARNGHTVGTGSDNVVEGPFVFYNNNTDYYYLMTTYGNLKSDYNMHIARSKSPAGPYTDVTGADMATLTDAGNVGGNKIAGNYKFAHATGTPYYALGHNSVIKDDEGKYFVVYHTRRQIDGGHTLYVSQLYFNEQSWPVMSPVAYEGETFGTVTEEQIEKTFEVVIHAETTVATVVSSEKYTLAADGKITKGGAEAGSWTLKDGYYITLVIDGKTFNGVVVPGWDLYPVPSQRAGRLCITAVSDKGVSLWAIEGKV